MSDAKTSALTAATPPLTDDWLLPIGLGAPTGDNRKLVVHDVIPWQRVAVTVSGSGDTSAAVTWDATVPHAVRVEVYGLGPAVDTANISMCADYTVDGGTTWTAGGTTGVRFTETGGTVTVYLDGTWLLAMPVAAVDTYLSETAALQFGAFETVQPNTGPSSTYVSGRWMGMSVHMSSSAKKYHQLWYTLTQHRTNLGTVGAQSPMNGFRVRLTNNAAIRAGTAVVCWWRPL